MEGLFLPKQFWLQRTIEKIGMVKILQHSQKKFLPNYVVIVANLPSSKPDILYKLQLTFSNIVLQGILQKEKKGNAALKKREIAWKTFSITSSLHP